MQSAAVQESSKRAFEFLTVCGSETVDSVKGHLLGACSIGPQLLNQGLLSVLSSPCLRQSCGH